MALDSKMAINYWMIPLIFCLLVCITTFITGWVYYGKEDKAKYNMSQVNTTVWMCVLCVLAALSICWLGVKALGHSEARVTSASVARAQTTALAKVNAADIAHINAAVKSAAADDALKHAQTVVAAAAGNK